MSPPSVDFKQKNSSKQPAPLLRVRFGLTFGVFCVCVCVVWSVAFFHSTPTCTWITTILSNILSNTSPVAISTALLLEQLITQKETVPSGLLYKDGLGYFGGRKQPAGFTAVDRGTVWFHPSVAGRVQIAKLRDTCRELSVTAVLW